MPGCRIFGNQAIAYQCFNDARCLLRICAFQARRSKGLVNGKSIGRSAQRRHYPPTRLAVRPLPTLPTRPHLGGRETGLCPCAVLAQWTILAFGGALRAHERPKLHDRHIPTSAIRTIFGQPIKRGHVLSARRRTAPSKLHPVTHTRKNSANIRIKDGDALVELEGGKSTRGIGTDPGQGQQGLVAIGNGSTEVAHNSLCALAKPQHPRGIAKVCPLDQSLGRGSGSEICRSRPQPHPPLPNWLHARDRGLLAHHLENQGSPRSNVARAHGELAAMELVPREDWRAKHLVIWGWHKR